MAPRTSGEREGNCFRISSDCRKERSFPRDCCHSHFAVRFFISSCDVATERMPEGTRSAESPEDLWTSSTKDGYMERLSCIRSSKGPGPEVSFRGPRIPAAAFVARPPGSDRSTSRTRKELSRRCQAMEHPMIPAPTMTISQSVVRESIIPIV